MTLRLPLLLALFSLLLIACGDQKNKNLATVNPGDHKALENLATAWETVSEQWPAPPRQLLPAGRRKFVDQVFTQAGYSYSNSLIGTGRSKLDPFNTDQKDLCELLLTPARGLAGPDLEKIYSAEELAAVDHIRKTFP